MKIERIWKIEARKRATTLARRERINRNWPIHAERIVLIFAAFAELAEKDGVHISINAPEWLNIRGEKKSTEGYRGSYCGVIHRNSSVRYATYRRGIINQIERK